MKQINYAAHLPLSKNMEIFQYSARGFLKGMQENGYDTRFAKKLL